jgi:acid phosphatase type 7
MRALIVALCLSLVLMVAAATMTTTMVPREEETMLERFFYKRLDGDHNGLVDRTELVRFALTTDPPEEKTSEVQITIDTVTPIIALYDLNSDGVWDYDEFSSAFPQFAAPGSVLSEDPHQIRLQSTGVFSSMIVMWATSNNVSSVVNWGETAGLPFRTMGTTFTYHVPRWSGYLHTVTLTSLKPGTTYYYNCGDGGSPSEGGHTSSIHSFTTEDPSLQSGRFAVVGDMGTVIPVGFKVAAKIADDHKVTPFDLVLHVGDLAYASVAMPAPPAWTGWNVADSAHYGLLDPDVEGNGEWEFIWDMFCDQIEGIAAQVPYVAGVGNHEMFYNFSSYLHRFQNPPPWGYDPTYPNEVDHAKFWFSFSRNGIHFTFMSTEHPYDPASPQYQWLEADLAAARAANYSWIIMTGHRPMYCSDNDEWTAHEPGAPFQQQIEPLMIKYGVDLYLSGHMHMMERVFPVQDGVPTQQQGHIYHNPGLPAHAVQGNSGVFTDHSYFVPTPMWSATASPEFGYGQMEVFNATHLTYTYIGLDGTVMDYFTIVKDAS